MRQLLWISDFLHNNEILLDNMLCSPQFVYIIILIGQMRYNDIQVKLCQVFYFKLIPCESSVKFLGHLKNKTNSRNIPAHSCRDISLHTSSHTKYTTSIWPYNFLCAAETLCANCRPVRLEWGAFSVISSLLLCKRLIETHTGGVFQLTAVPCSIQNRPKQRRLWAQSQMVDR